MSATPTASPLPSLAAGPSTGSIVMLFVVLAFLVVAAYFTTRFVGGKAGRFYRSKYIQMLDRLNISRDKALLIIRVGDKDYMLGVTAQQINCLDALDADKLVELTPDKTAAPGWMQHFFVPRRDRVDNYGNSPKRADADTLDAMEQRMRERAERNRQAVGEDKERGR